MGSAFINDIWTKAGKTYRGLINYQETLNRKIEESTQGIRDLGLAYLQTESDSFDYWKMSEDKQGMLTLFMDNLSSDFIRESGIESLDDYKKKLDEIASAISELDNSQVEKYKIALNATTEFNNNQLTYEEWLNKINAFINILPENSQKTFKIAFSVDAQEDKYNRAVNMLKSVDGAGGNFTEKGEENSIKAGDVIGQLNSEQLDYYVENNLSEKIQAYKTKNPDADADAIATYLKKVINKGIAKAKKQNGESNLSELFEDLTNFGKAIKTLNEAYSELNEDGNITFDTLNSIREAFANVSGIDTYINKLAEAKGNTKETTKIMNELTTAYIKNKLGVDDLANANKNVIASLLKENGVANSNEVALQMVAKAKWENAVESGNLSKKTATEISNLLKEAGVTKTVVELTNLFTFQKQLSNKNSLNTVNSVKQLENYARSANITGQVLQDIILLENLLKKSKSDDYNAHLISYYQNKIKNADYTSSIDFDIGIEYTGNGNGTSKNNSFKTKEDNWLEKRQKELEKQQNRNEIGIISEDKYYSNVAKILKKFAPKIKSKKAEINKLKKQIQNSPNGSTQKENLQTQLKQSKSELDAIIKEQQDIQKQVHNYLENKKKTEYEKYQEQLLEAYTDGTYDKNKVKKAINKRLKAIKKFDKDLYKELKENLPEWYEEIDKSKFDRQNDKNNTLHDFDLINDKEYYNQKLIIAENFYKTNKKQFKDDYVSALKDLYSYAKDEYQKDLENQKEALEDKKEALEDFYDKQRELLDKQADLDEYKTEQSEKRSDINSIKSQIQQLKRDSSTTAQKRILELQSELKDAQKDLDEFEKEHALEETKARLEELQTQAIESIDKQIEGLDKQLDNLNENTANIYNAVKAFAEKNGIKGLPSANTVKAIYGSGTSNSIGGTAITQDKGNEVVGINIGQGRFTYLTPNSTVISASGSKLLYEFANNPKTVLSDLLGQANKGISAIQSINNDNKQILNVNNTFNIQGNANKNVLDNAGKEMAMKVLQEFRKLK